jgi:tetratricopeptide (TPR) repeat protein
MPAMSSKLALHCAVAAAALIVQSWHNDVNPAACAQAHSVQGLLYHQLGQWPQAMTSYKAAIAEFEAADDLFGIGQTCRQMGVLFLQQQQYGLARRWAELAVYGFARANQSTNNPALMRSHQAAALHLLGKANFHLGHQTLAVKQLEKVLSIRYELQDAIGEALALVDLGQIYQARQQHWPALACYEGALDICQPREAAFEGGWFEAKVRYSMAELYRSSGHWDLALKHYLEALALGPALGAQVD